VKPPDAARCVHRDADTPDWNAATAVSLNNTGTHTRRAAPERVILRVSIDLVKSCLKK
jgi:hypothetical protein